jgi:hypothetical protein
MIRFVLAMLLHQDGYFNEWEGILPGLRIVSKYAWGKANQGLELVASENEVSETL